MGAFDPLSEPKHRGKQSGTQEEMKAKDMGDVMVAHRDAKGKGMDAH